MVKADSYVVVASHAISFREIRTILSQFNKRGPLVLFRNRLIVSGVILVIFQPKTIDKDDSFPVKICQSEYDVCVSDRY